MSFLNLSTQYACEYPGRVCSQEASSSLKHDQVASLICTDVDTQTSKRVRAKETAIKVIQSLQTEEISIAEIDSEIGVSRGFLYFSINNRADGTPFGLLEGKPTNLLVLYHYRKYGEFSRYSEGEFSKKWIIDKLGLISSAHKERYDKGLDSLILASTICNETNAVSLHIIEKDAANLERTIASLRRSLKTDSELESLPSVDGRDGEEEIEDLRRKLEAALIGVV